MKLEYKLKTWLENKGWVVVRSAGSHGAADIVALRGGTIVLAQCKYGSASISKQEKEKLLQSARTAKAIAVLVTQTGRKWKFTVIARFD